MSTAVLDRPVLDRPMARAATRTAPRVAPARAGDGGPSLEGVIVRAWEGLAAHRGVGCPLCGGTMKPRYGASGMAPVGGRCHDCGTTLG
jgi:hypothetical protein